MDVARDIFLSALKSGYPKVVDIAARVYVSAARDLRRTVADAFRTWYGKNPREPEVSELVFLFTRLREAHERNLSVLNKASHIGGKAKRAATSASKDSFAVAQNAARSLKAKMDSLGQWREDFSDYIGLRDYL